MITVDFTEPVIQSAVGVTAIPDNANTAQPQGVVKTLDLTQIPKAGFFSNEFVESDGQITLPNVLILTGDATAELVINNGLLRTQHDSMAIHTEGNVNLTLIIPKQKITNLATAKQDENAHFVKKWTLTASTPTVFHLRLVDANYILTKEEIVA